MNKITTAQKTLEYYVVLSGESTPPVPTPTQVTIDGNFEIEQSGSTYTMSFGIQDFDWSSLQSGWTGTVVYGQNTLTFDSSNLNNNTITISVSESQIDLNATTATMEITSGTDEYEGTSNVEVGFVDYMFVENTYNGTNTLTLTTTTAGSPTTDYSTTVQYSKDRTNWTTVTFDTSTPYNISMNQGEKVYFRNNNGKFNYFDRNSKDYHTSITCSESNNAGGNLNSLLDYTNIETVTLPIGAFYRLFSDNATLKDASDIKIKHTVLKDYSHGYLFSGCSSLVEVPDFSRITTLGYGSMCNVFYNCSGLVTPPDFDSLVDTGERSGLSWAFYNCTSLQRPPRFPSLTRVGYYGLNRCFMNCRSLTYGSDLSSVTNLGTKGLERMYSSCSSLSSATVPTLSSWTTSNSSDWLAGVAATGTLYNYGTSTIPTGTSGVPSGWTVVTQ